MAFKNCKSAQSKGWGFYKEIQDLAGFHRNYVCAASLVGRFQGGMGFLKQKARKGGGGICRREGKVYFKIKLR